MINNNFLEVQTEHNNFVVGITKNINYEFWANNPVEGETVNKILYHKGSVYICKAKENSLLCVLTA